MRSDIYTIWGTSESVDEVMKGLRWVTTPSHGGFVMTPTLAREFPPALLKCGELRCGSWWFEEDCAACAVVSPRFCHGARREAGRLRAAA